MSSYVRGHALGTPAYALALGGIVMAAMGVDAGVWCLFAGFLGWIVSVGFLATASIGLLRREPTDESMIMRLSATYAEASSTRGMREHRPVSGDLDVATTQRILRNSRITAAALFVVLILVGLIAR
jgi:hypothetical protein